MGKKVKRATVGVATLGGSEIVRAAGGPAIDELLFPTPAKPGKMPKPLAPTTEVDLAAARAAELEERKKRRISLITSPGGAFLSSTDLSRPKLLGQ